MQSDVYWFNKLNSSECMYKETPCYKENETSNQFTLADIKTYCGSGDNMLTEPVCYNWFVNSVYPGTHELASVYDRESADTLMKESCNKYPYSKKCSCMYVIKDNASKSFQFKNDPTKGYNVSCLYSACSKDNKSYNPAYPTPYIPYSIIGGNFSCPENLCANVLNDVVITMDGGSELNLKNECNNNNSSVYDSDVVNENKVSIDEADVDDKKMVIIYISIAVFLLLIIILIISKLKRKSKERELSKLLMLKMLTK